MIKSIISILIVVLLVSISAICVNSVTEHDLSELDNCRYLYTDNNSSGSYVYGYSPKTLYSAQLIPEVKLRYISYNGIIRCVCQNGVNTYALFETDTSERKYVLVQLNMNNGVCNYYTFTGLKHFDNSSIAVTDNEVFFMRTDSHYSYITSYSYSGSKLYEYRFDDEVSDLFVNNSKAYTRLYSGDIYRLSKGTYNFCTSVSFESDFINGGKGFIYTDYGKLLSLENNTAISAPYNSAVYDGSIFYTNGKTVVNNDKYYTFSNNISKLLVNSNKIAVLFSNYSCQIINFSDLKEYKSDNSDVTVNKTEIPNSTGTPYNTEISYTTEIPYTIDGNIICGIDNGITVSEFKKKFSTAVFVYNLNGENVTSGLIKTGYSTVISGKTYSISVRGDITGEGNVKSNDISELMSVFIQKSQLNGVYYKSADFNLDGKVNNKDLVLIAQKYESEK